MKTRVTELLGIEKPIIQGGMAWVATAELAAAVSEAGGLGVIGSGSASATWVEEQVKKVRERTDKPFGVNIMMMNPHTPEIAEVIARLKVPAVTTGAGTPGPYIEMWKEAGVKVIPVISSAAIAKRMEKVGADAVIAEGCEAGGHIGELTTMALTPSVCDAVSIPVITAGGVADGRGLVAAFALGAEGVQMGTRFLSAEECIISDAYKQKVLAAKDSDTIVTGRATGHPVRQLKNKFSRSVAKSEREVKSSLEEQEIKLAGSLRRAVEGDVVTGSMMSGQVACLVGKIQPAQEILDEIVAEAEAWSGHTMEEMAKHNAARTWRTGTPEEVEA